MSTTTRTLDTAGLTKVAAIGAIVGWVGTLALGLGLGGSLSLDLVVLGISLFWLVLTAGVVAYVRPRTPPALSGNVVWQYWLVASVLGTLVNIAAALLLTTGAVTGDPLEETVPMEFGVLLPWLLIYAGGFLLPAIYRRDSPALNRAERGIYGIAGAVSLALAFVLAVDPSLYPVMLLALAGLSLAPLLTVRYRG